MGSRVAVVSSPSGSCAGGLYNPLQGATMGEPALGFPPHGAHFVFAREAATTNYEGALRAAAE